ncbi:hypothetical protein G7046_g8108 [Stylonectria norvegica]|nr:hypothetical protein G7046_g8108 [Stylonectria norvegica]
MGDLQSSYSSPSSPPEPPPPPPSRLVYEVLFRESFDDLTEPLPSPEEIEESPDIIRKLSARCTTRVGESFVVKHGVEVEPIEADNMRFVRENTTDIRVPRVLATYQRSLSPTCHITYIIMERIPGNTLEYMWDNLDDGQKQTIANQLQKVFSSLRKLPHPGFFGSIEKSGLRDGMFWMDVPVPNINGPFATEGKLIEGMIIRFVRDTGTEMRHKAEYYRRVLPKALQGNGEPAFTHGDLQRKNVIICPDGGVAIVDWAASGWYPSYWEYATAMFACGNWRDDWHVYLAKILDEYPNQFAWMKTLRIEMWG